MLTHNEQNASTVAPEAMIASQAALATDLLAKEAEPVIDKPEILEELVIEEVSIDGMCGVY